MQRKVKFVLGLIIAFLVIIDALQITWLYNNYKEEKAQYERTLTNAIGDAATYYQLQNINKAPHHSAPFYIVSSKDPIKYQLKDGEIVFTATAISLDSIEGGLGHSQLVQMQTRNQFNIHVFDSILKERLLEAEIDAPYILDTLVTPPATKRNKNSSKSNKLVATKAEYTNVYKDYPVKTAAMMVNTYGNLFVYASFKPYPQFIYRKMFWPLVSSLLIFIITNIAFIYVLKTIRQQKKLNDIKNDFINNMTHELRTPITVATSAIDAILNHHGLEDKRKAQLYLQTSKGELLHLDHLVEKILNIAVEDKKDLELSYERINIRQLLSTIIDNHKLVAAKEVQFYLDADAAIEVKGDRLHLANAVNNIIDNAVKYSNDAVDIHIQCRVENKNLVVTIKDNGIGIENEYLAQVFQPFFRVPKGNLHDVKGFGLGLSYVKKVIQKHGGSVNLTSTVGEGSLFTLSIPVNQ